VSNFIVTGYQLAVCSLLSFITPRGRTYTQHKAYKYDNTNTASKTLKNNIQVHQGNMWHRKCTNKWLKWFRLNTTRHCNCLWLFKRTKE